MPVFDAECPKHGVFEDFVMSYASDHTCPTCGALCKRLISGMAGHKMPAETTSPKYQAWFHSASTQAKLRNGEYKIASKSSDVNHA